MSDRLKTVAAHLEGLDRLREIWFGLDYNYDDEGKVVEGFFEWATSALAVLKHDIKENN